MDLDTLFCPGFHCTSLLPREHHNADNNIILHNSAASLLVSTVDSQVASTLGTGRCWRNELTGTHAR